MPSIGNTTMFNQARCSQYLATLLITATILSASPSFSDEIDLRPWNQAEVVFIGKLDNAIAGPVARSLPPIYSHKLQFTVEKVLRGNQKPNKPIEVSHSARQLRPPVFPVGDLCLVAATRSRGGLKAHLVLKASDERIKAVTAACSLPLGWSFENDKPVSPWAGLGENAWSAESEAKSDFVCSETGRPALMVGSAAKYSVEKVPPRQEIKWTNPDGDGEFRVTVSNPTNKPIEIPALLTVDGKVLWDESLVILCQNKVYPIPGAVGVSGNVKPAVLGPGKSLSHVVNALSISGPEWPKGGYRIDFRICLGEKSQTMSFYYRSKHHDAIRDASQK